MQHTRILLTVLEEWWPRLLGLASLLLAVGVAVRKYRADELVKARKEIKRLTGHVTLLMTENTIHIDIEQNYVKKIKDLEDKVIEQRRDLFDDANRSGANHPKIAGS